MKILSCSAENFASYERLEFNFEDQGLTLISGPTGSGKSTLCDLIPWCLYGRTAKGGAVDDIRRWNTPSGVTKGEIHLRKDSGEMVHITRVRGANSNDLLYRLGGIDHRGKDLKDTQYQVDRLLGCDFDLFILGSYYNEFSPITTFFTANAKIRRSIIEQLVNLSLANQVQEGTNKYKKDLNLEIKEMSLGLDQLKYSLHQLELDKAAFTKKSEGFKAKEIVSKEEVAAQKMAKRIALKLEYNIEIQELEREHIALRVLHTCDPILDKPALQARIEELKKVTCSECGMPKKTDQIMVLMKDLHKMEIEERVQQQRLLNITKLEQSMDFVTKLYNLNVRKLEEESTFLQPVMQDNPYTALINERTADITSKKRQQEKLIIEKEELHNDLLDTDSLLEVVQSFRTVLTGNTIVWLQDTTNSLLSKYFDAEITVSFSAEGADKIEVLLYKDGNTCSYSQLSKGQRHLLKLCFGIAVMRHVENHHGLSFSSVFIDEGLSGLDENLLTRAFNLFQEISLDHSSTFVVEHNEALKALFAKEYKVKLVHGKSQLEEPV